MKNGQRTNPYTFVRDYPGILLMLQNIRAEKMGDPIGDKPLGLYWAILRQWLSNEIKRKGNK